MFTNTLQLPETGELETSIIHFNESDNILRIVIPLGSNFHSKDLEILTDYPATKKIVPTKPYNAAENLSYDLELSKPGMYYLQFKVSELESKKLYILVDPAITINNKKLPKNDLRIQSINLVDFKDYSKLIEKIEEVSKNGYNIIHFVTNTDIDICDFEIVQTLPDTKKEMESTKTFKLIEKLPEIEKKYDVGFMNDIHLHKLSDDIDWILSQPEFTVNEISSPWIKKAVELDDILFAISSDIDRSLINDVNATKNLLLGKLMASSLKNQYVIDTDSVLEQYSLYDIKQLPKDLKPNLKKYASATLKEKVDAVKANAFKDRKADIEFIVSVFGEADETTNSELIITLADVNKPYLDAFTELCEEICKNEAEFLYNHQNVTVRRLFTQKEISGQLVHVAYEGFVPDVTDSASNTDELKNYYFTRKVVCNEGVIKICHDRLNEPNQELFNHMKEAFDKVSEFSQILRLIDIKSANETFLQRCIDETRTRKPNIFITTQLDPQIVESKGIEILSTFKLNAILRDCSYNYDAYELSHIIWQAGGCDIGSISKLRNLVNLNTQIPSILFDKLPGDDWKVVNPLSLCASISMAYSPIGSSYQASKYAEIRSALNSLHTELSHLSCETDYHAYGGILSIHRMNSDSGEGVWMLTRFKYSDDTPQKIQIPAEKITLRFETLISDRVHFNTKIADFVQISDQRIDVERLPLGAVIVYDTEYCEQTKQVIQKLSNGTTEAAIDQQLQDISLMDLNGLMFKGESEENGYNIDGINISGIDGILRVYHENEAAISKHLKSGDWLLDYTVQRLFRSQNLIPLSQFLRTELLPYKKFQPRSILPKYFYKLMEIINNSFTKALSFKLTPFATQSDEFIQQLTRYSISLYGTSGERRFLASRIPEQCLFGTKTLLKEVLVAIRGNLIVTGRFEDAKRELSLLAQKSLDSGNAAIALLYPQALQDYFLLAPDGRNILTEKLSNGRTFLYYVLQIIERYGAIETIKSTALLASALRWLDHCQSNNIISEKTVCNKTFIEWHNEIEKTFDEKYYSEDRKYDGVIVDVLLSIVVAPEIFDSVHAVDYIRNVSNKVPQLNENIIPATVAFLIRASATMKRRLSNEDIKAIGIAKVVISHLRKYGISAHAVGSLLDAFYDYQKLKVEEFIDWSQYLD